MILGPCSAETREQVLETACALKEACSEPFIYRAGVWKPRTNPHTFQGAGEKALEWLREVKERFGMNVATEVATPEHVEAALKAGIDYLWIGARTSANPIAVEAIAETIADRLRLTECRPASPDRIQTDLPLKGIFIKNPANEDAGLWIGNIERLEKTGVPVIAIHRGCNHQPCWAMAHQLRLTRPDIPLLMDPSHMSGEAAKVPALMEKKAELGLDGAMIEVHCCPEKALSDSKQQLTPALIPSLLSGESHSKTSETETTELNWLRAEIDELDERLWETMAARMDVSKRIGVWKKAQGIAPLQQERYQAILDKRQQWAMQKGLPEQFVKQLFEIIHEQSLREQI